MITKLKEVCTYNVILQYTSRNTGIYQKLPSPTIKYFEQVEFFNGSDDGRKQFQGTVSTETEVIVVTDDTDMRLNVILYSASTTIIQ